MDAKSFRSFTPRLHQIAGTSFLTSDPQLTYVVSSTIDSALNTVRSSYFAVVEKSARNTVKNHSILAFFPVYKGHPVHSTTPVSVSPKCSPFSSLL